MGKRPRNGHAELRPQSRSGRFEKIVGTIPSHVLSPLESGIELVEARGRLSTGRVQRSEF